MRLRLYCISFGQLCGACVMLDWKKSCGLNITIMGPVDVELNTTCNMRAHPQL